jgi:predicted Fe-Mo cluster-binding NifX family protein
MSYKIAAATTNGENIDQHFGSAEVFWVYEISDEGEPQSTEKRIVGVGADEPSSDLPEEENSGCDSGCGKAQGGCGGGAKKASPRIQKAVELLCDCEYLLAVKIGAGAENALKTRGVS